MQDEKNTALSVIEKERRGLTVRVGHSALVQSEEGITLSSPVIEIKKILSRVSDKRNQTP